MKLTEAAVETIATELGCRFSVEPYRVDGEKVYAAEIAPESGASLRLILWPSIGRVDVRLAQATMVLKDVERVEVVPGIEVVFRRRGGGRLFVTRSGQANMAV